MVRYSPIHLSSQSASLCLVHHNRLFNIYIPSLNSLEGLFMHPTTGQSRSTALSQAPNVNSQLVASIERGTHRRCPLQQARNQGFDKLIQL